MACKSIYVLSSTVSFIAHPRERGRWLRVHSCVAFAACDYCKAKRGAPCMTTRGEVSLGTHHSRRAKTRKKTAEQGSLITNFQRGRV